MEKRREWRKNFTCNSSVCIDDWFFDNFKQFIIWFLGSKLLIKISSFVLEGTLRYPGMKLEI